MRVKRPDSASVSFFPRSKEIGLFIYGCGRVVFTNFDPHSQGADLYRFLSRKLNIPLHAGILIHRGKVVNSESTLNDQGLLNGSNVFFMTRARGGGKDTRDEQCSKGSFHTHTRFLASNLSINIGNECESCGESGMLWCSVCQQTRCNICDSQWHKHSSRRNHIREVS